MHIYTDIYSHTLLITHYYRRLDSSFYCFRFYHHFCIYPQRELLGKSSNARIGASRSKSRKNRLGFFILFLHHINWRSIPLSALFYFRFFARSNAVVAFCTRSSSSVFCVFGITASECFYFFHVRGGRRRGCWMVDWH